MVPLGGRRRQQSPKAAWLVRLLTPVPCQPWLPADKPKTVSRFNVLFEGEREAGLQELRNAALEHHKRLHVQIQYNAARDAMPLTAAPTLQGDTVGGIMQRIGAVDVFEEPTVRPSMLPAYARHCTATCPAVLRLMHWPRSTTRRSRRHGVCTSNACRLM